MPFAPPMIGTPGNGISLFIVGPLVMMPVGTPLEQWQSGAEEPRSLGLDSDIRENNPPPLEVEESPVLRQPLRSDIRASDTPPAKNRRIDIGNTPVRSAIARTSGSTRSTARTTNIDLKRFCADFVEMQSTDSSHRAKSLPARTE